MGRKQETERRGEIGGWQEWGTNQEGGDTSGRGKMREES